jgi:hypothetical protein
MKLNDKQKDDLWAVVITVAMVGFFTVIAVLSYIGK